MLQLRKDRHIVSDSGLRTNGTAGDRGPNSARWFDRALLFHFGITIVFCHQCQLA